MKAKKQCLIGVGCYITGRENTINSIAVAISEHGLNDMEILCAGRIQKKDSCHCIVEYMNSILLHHSEYRVAFNANNFNVPNSDSDKLYDEISLELFKNFRFTKASEKNKNNKRLIIGNDYFYEGERLDECLTSAIKPDYLMANNFSKERYAAICAVKAIQASYKIFSW